MDVQTSSPHSTCFSLEDALHSVSQDLVYDPTTKQLCIRSHLPATQKNGQSLPHKKDDGLIDLDLNKLPVKSVFSDCDSGYGGLSSESNTENGSQKSVSESGPNENVDDLDLSIDDLSSGSASRTVKSKLKFIQNVLNKITDNVTIGSSTGSCDSSTENSAPNQDDSIIETIIDNRALCLGKRPPYLPPKSDEEQRRHQAEFNEILKQAKKRELKESKLKRRILSKQIRQEEEISDAIRCWTNDILPAWPSSRALKRTRDLWWSGIPSPVRPKVWSMAIGNELKITDELFRICVERSRERIWTKQFVCRRSSNPYPSSSAVFNDGMKHHRRVASQPIHTVRTVRRKPSSLDVETLGKQLQSSCQIRSDAYCAKSCTSMDNKSEEEEEDEEDKNESIAYLIKLDVSRTFPQLGLFQESGPLHQSLSDILAAYAVFRPDTSYCQGMSFLAAMLLLNLDSPSDAFTAFANLLNSELLLVFYRLVPEKIAAVYEFYDRQLEALLPRLSTHLRSIGLTTDLFFVDQIYTLFSRSLPLEVACRTWDLYLRDGDEFIFRASLALLAMYESVLLELECAEAAQWLAHLPEDMNSEKYFSTIATLKLVPPKLWYHSLESKDRAEKNGETANITLVKKLFPF